MSRRARFVRRNRVDERSAASIALLGAALAVPSGAAPTGFDRIDMALILVACGAVVFASASAPWWALASASAVGAALAFHPVWVAVGVVGFAWGLFIGVRRRDLGVERALVGAIAVNVSIRSDVDAFLGFSAIVGVNVGVALVVLGVLRRPRQVRRVVYASLVGVGVVATLCVATLAVTGLAARFELSDAAARTREAVALLDEGDYAGAAMAFGRASDAFERADDRLGGPLSLPTRLLPVVAQNVGAGADLSQAAATATRRAADALEQVDVDDLRVQGGRIDVEAIRALGAPLALVHEALVGLQSTTETTDSPWIVGPVQDELDGLRVEFVQNEVRLLDAIEAVRLAPQLLGSDGTRRYLVLFTTPAEARGLSGFIGNYAEVAMADGQIRVTDFARRSDLERANLDDPAFCTTCEDELLARYGAFGFSTGPDGAFGPRGWSNITMPAHYPYVARAAQVLYPQNGGNTVDGVIVMDPYVLQVLMGYTGAIDVPQFDVTVEPEGAAQFILEDQYLLADDVDGEFDNGERVDALDTLGTEVILRLLTGSLPEPAQLARDMAPLVEERRLLIWTDDAEEQALFDRIGLLGSIPPLGPDGGFSLSVTNAGSSKIDVFLEREVDVTVDVANDGSRSLTADVTLTNTAPASGLPDYVIGNVVGLPTGTSRLFVTFYGTPLLTSSTIDDRALPLQALPEAGWMAYSTVLDLRAGESARMRLQFAIDPLPAGVDPTDPPAAEPTVWEQPLASRGE